MVKNLTASAGETQVQSLGPDDPLEEGMATHSSILTWRIPVDRGAWRTIVHGLQRVRHALQMSSPIITATAETPRAATMTQ